ncbi:MAG: VCBS repeat-containing protein [Nonomuraea sp.]|nr:VCBS repeat-containing protein [Nonomuraea sp.]
MFSVPLPARWTIPVVAGLVALGVAPPQDLGHAQAAPSAPVRDDFDGDGYGDLVVGAPGATVDGRRAAGYVTVLYGGPHGLSTGRRSVISRATQGIPGGPTANEGFGRQLSRGDLDGDGYADLVVGLRTKGDAVIVWGGRRGLSGAATSIPASRTVPGDYDGDGHLDLAAFRTSESPGDDPLGTTAAVWSGPFSRAGKPAATGGLDGVGGYDVVDGASGDVNGDGRDDLALNVYIGDGGFSTAFYLASTTHLTALGSEAVPQGAYADAVALGDFDHDGYDDLVVGLCGDQRIEVARGFANGLRPRSTWTSYSLDTPGVPRAAAPNDCFGSALSAGDVTGDGVDDLAVGVSGEEIGHADGAGAVTLLHGGRAGLTGQGAQTLTQDTAGIVGTSEPGDGFGSAVRLLDVNGNGYADLAVAAAGEDKGDGRVWELRGRPEGVVTDAALRFDGRSVGAPSARAGFGAALQ